MQHNITKVNKLQMKNFSKILKPLLLSESIFFIEGRDKFLIKNESQEQFVIIQHYIFRLTN